MNLQQEIEDIWSKGRILKEAFQEYRDAIKNLYSKADMLLCSPANIPEEFKVEMDKIPQDFFSLRKNLFSVLFQSVYWLLDIPKERRVLYGKINHLFRIWVTSADNLLDNEDKVVVPMKLPGNSRIMRQVISVMVADRIMKDILDEAVKEEVITLQDSRVLSNGSLQILLPSAAEEASEENGITQRPDPHYVLYTIHKLKTGLLFNIPFLGPEKIENNINATLLSKYKDGLTKFGLGCQLLDDISDIAKDYLEKRHNYVLSKIYWENRINDIEKLEKIKNDIDVYSKIFIYFRETTYSTAELAGSLLKEGLFILNESGLGIGKKAAIEMSISMFNILGVGELSQCLQI